MELLHGEIVHQLEIPSSKSKGTPTDMCNPTDAIASKKFNIIISYIKNQRLNVIRIIDITYCMIYGSRLLYATLMLKDLFPELARYSLQVQTTGCPKKKTYSS